MAAEASAPAGPEVDPSAPARLPAESIQTAVRWNLGRFRACYQEGLLKYPGLEGRVAVRFVVAPSGQVVEPLVAASDVPEPVSWCILSAFRQLRFPATDGGAIQVIYPFRLTRNGLVDAAAVSRPNVPTPRASGGSATAGVAAAAGARTPSSVNRLFALFRAGAAGSAASSREPTPDGLAAPSAGPEPSPGTAQHGKPPDGPDPSAVSTCHPGDPLCSDITP